MATISPLQVDLRDGTRLEVRSAAQPDTPAVVALLRTVAAERDNTITEPDEVVSEDKLAAEIADAAGAPGRLMLVAAAGGAPIGALSAWPGRRRREQHRLKFGLLVAPEWRGRGVGRAIIQALLAWASEHPTIEKVSLSVFAGNRRAIALYRSLGFRTEGRRVAEFKLGPENYADDIMMAKFVKGPNTSCIEEPCAEA